MEYIWFALMIIFIWLKKNSVSQTVLLGISTILEYAKIVILSAKAVMDQRRQTVCLVLVPWYFPPER